MITKPKLTLLILICYSSITWAQTVDIAAILKRSEDKLRSSNSLAHITINIIRPTWSREMKMKSWTMGEDYSMMLITAPAKDKGTVFLKRKNEIWNWLPNIERTVKLPPSMMMQNWMGTDITNDDLVKQSSYVNDFDHKLLGTETIESRECYKVALIPKEDAVVVWGKIVIWIDKKDDLQLKVEFYDEDEILINVMNARGIKDLSGRIIATEMEIIPVEEEGQKTIITYDNIEFDIDKPESFFSTNMMKRVR